MTTAEAYEQRLRAVIDDRDEYLRVLMAMISASAERTEDVVPDDVLYVFDDGSCMGVSVRREHKKIFFYTRVGHAYPVGRVEC